MRQPNITSPESTSASDPPGLPPLAAEGLRAVFAQHKNIEQATLYGSRAKGNHRPNSDIDLMLTAPKLSWDEFNRIELEIDDLLLPWKVDLALKHQIENPDLMGHIARVGVRIY
ncbi:MAG TPA: nucleotidyltransferase domain-containing protein [Halothiobacillaceae bacterium]|nr:nucleotidyltransferase domain-containing protein [Halothiobacillaceae bacterium]